MSDRSFQHLPDSLVEACCDRIETRAILACLRLKAMFMPMPGHLATSTAFTTTQLMERLQNKTPPERG